MTKPIARRLFYLILVSVTISHLTPFFTKQTVSSFSYIPIILCALLQRYNWKILSRDCILYLLETFIALLSYPTINLFISIETPTKHFYTLILNCMLFLYILYQNLKKSWIIMILAFFTLKSQLAMLTGLKL